jgi:hypothetical protein
MVEPSVLNVAIQQKMLEQLTDYRTQVRVIRIEQGVGVGIFNWQMAQHLKPNCLLVQMVQIHLYVSKLY